MSKHMKLLLVVTAGLFLFGLLGTCYVFRPTECRMAEIVQDGTVLYTLDLAAAENQEIIITSPEGKTNTIRIESGEICICHAECPDQTCVKMGVLYSESLPIVCLPHKLIVRFK